MKALWMTVVRVLKKLVTLEEDEFDDLYSTCKKAVDALHPDEAEYFALAWDKLRTLLKMRVATEDELVALRQERICYCISPEHKPINVYELESLRSANAMTISFFKLAQEAPVTRTRIVEVLEECARKMGLRMPPATFAQALTPILESDFKGLTKPLEWPALRSFYMYHWKDGRSEISEADIIRINDRKKFKEYELFFNSIKLEVWVKNRMRDLNVQTGRLCEFLLKQVGKTFTRRDVEMAVWPEELSVHDKTYSMAFTRLHEVTRNVLRDELEHKRGSEYTTVRKGLKYAMITCE